jgi:hypothetical protein
MAKYKITDSFIADRAAEAGDRNRIFYDDHRDAPVGFGVRVTKSGAVAFVLNYYGRAADGSLKERRATIGTYGKRQDQESIASARKKAAHMRNKVLANGDPLAERHVAREAAKAAAAESERKRDYSLQALMTAYTESLKAAGKPSWREIDKSVQRNVVKPFPKLAKRPADEITVDDVMPVFHALIKAGTFNEARKLRAYLRAAYSAAKRARTDASMHTFAGFQIRANPLAELEVTRPKETAAKAASDVKERKWALSEAQLQAYWKRITAMDDARGALLRFHLLTGGQRVEQLCRLTVDDWDAQAHTVTLWDTKGRRTKAHKHQLPLIPEAAQALQAMRGEESKGPYLVTVTAGKEAAVTHTVWEATKAVADAMVADGEIERSFSPGIIRKTVETRLQAVGVSKEIRAQLLSHGLGGVQAQHYESHDYQKEKLAALRKLRGLLEPKGKILKFPAKAG